MNVGDYGNELIFGTGFNGAGFDMSGATGLSILFTRPDGTTFTVTEPQVAIGSTNVTVPGGIFNAHQYVTYYFIQGQLTKAGSWQARLIYDVSSALPPIHFNTNIARFNVGP
jgi:hypothetical protein